MAAADSSSNISMGNNNDDIETNAKPNPNPDPDSFSKALVSIPSGSPIVCLQQFAGDSLAGAFMGSIFGFGAGLIKRKGFKPSIGEAASHAKTFAVLSGVHSLVVCFLKRLRRKDDVFNSGVAGCCTGLALSFPGEPTALLQSCLTFGAFSYVMDMLNKQQPAMAHSLSVRDRSRLFKAPTPSLALTLSLPLPAELKGAFSSFCESLRKPNDNNGCCAC